MGYSDTQALRAMEFLSDEQSAFSLNSLSLGALQQLASMLGSFPSSRYDLPKARVNLNNLAASKPSVGLAVALYANSFAADD